MQDKYDRKIDYLRVSVTDRCNLRCVYCMPKEGVEWKPIRQILRYEELQRVIEAAAGIGIKKIRVTGGEPLVRRGIVSFIDYINNTPGIEDISITTNGLLLAEMLPDLKRAGLKRVNISLDTLDGATFHKLTRSEGVEKVLRAIDMALAMDMKPVKVNLVLLKGVNEEDAVKMALWTKDKEIDVRFIELMPLGSVGKEYFLGGSEIEKKINEIAELKEWQGKGNGPAAYKQFEGAKGKVGFITPVTNHFCSRCNRIRLTADGKLKPCLMSGTEIDIKTALREGASIAELQEILRNAIASKPERHHLEKDEFQRERKMSQIGG